MGRHKKGLFDSLKRFLLPQDTKKCPIPDTFCALTNNKSEEQRAWKKEQSATLSFFHTLCPKKGKSHFRDLPHSEPN
jgi:hypothetical protein